MQDYSAQLKKYLPEQTAPIISAWIQDTGCIFKISRSRSTKFGDYRAPYQGLPHRISINHDLNPYAFLITTIHEFAHLRTFQLFKHRVKPHGKEWKNNFKELMDPFLKIDVFPDTILQAIKNYMDNPAASSCTDLNLFRALQQYDIKSDRITVEMIPEDGYFAMKNGRVFQKKNKLRKRFHCIELSTQRVYLFHPIAEIIPITAHEKFPL